MNEGKSNMKAEEMRGLDSLLSTNETILDRINSVRGRLESMNTRLHGEQPEVATEGCNVPTSGGTMGRLYEIQQASLRMLDCVDECFGRVESSI